MSMLQAEFCLGIIELITPLPVAVEDSIRMNDQGQQIVISGKVSENLERYRRNMSSVLKKGSPDVAARTEKILESWELCFSTRREEILFTV